MMDIPCKNCSSCGACANACPRKAITMKLNQDGFYRPNIDIEKCLQCGTCEQVCPWKKHVQNTGNIIKNPRAIAAFSKDFSIRMKSSSGGLFSVFAEKILEEGGAVVGVAQLEKDHFGHIIVEDKKDLDKLRSSKYVQADVGFIYKQTFSLLKENRKVLFSGTPCQISALLSYTRGKYNNNLTTIDIVCHGASSVKVFKKYVQELEAKENASVLSSTFRDKRKSWRLFSMTSSLKNVSGEETCYSKSLKEDKYLHIFLKNISLNNSCADCHYNTLPRIADITLGDYWNVSKFHPHMDDEKGTSLVLLNSQKGEDLFNSVSPKIQFCESKLDYAISGNSCIVKSTKFNPHREEFFRELDTHTLDELIQKYCPFPSKFKLFVQSTKSFGGKIIRYIKRRKDASL